MMALYLKDVWVLISKVFQLLISNSQLLLISLVKKLMKGKNKLMRLVSV